MSARYVRIKDCADVHPGFSIKTKVVHEPKGAHQVIIAKHLTEGAPYSYQPDQELRITPARPTENYLLKPDDILFMSRGARNVATLLLSFPQPAIAPSTFYILRSKKNIYPSYLAWIINQEPVQIAIGELRTGAGTPMIPRMEFSEILIPLPPLNIQQKIAEMDNLMRKEQNLLQRLSEKRKKMITTLCLQTVQARDGVKEKT